MRHLKEKPFYLTDEDIQWVSDTLADMTEEDFIYFLGDNSVSLFDYLDEEALKEELKYV